MKKIPLTWQMVVAAVAAMLCWYVFPVAAEYAGEVTDLYIRILSLILTPYVFFSMMNVFTKETSEGVFGRLALKNLTWFILVQTFAVAVSLFVSDIVFQNFDLKPFNQDGSLKGVNQEKNFGDFIFYAVPENYFEAVTSNNLLTVLLITCVLGHLASKCKDRTMTYLSSFFSSFSELVQKCADLVLRLSPFGVFCFMCKLLVQGGIFKFSETLTPFIIAVSASLALYSFGILPLIIKVMTKYNPFNILKIFSSTLLISAVSRNSFLTTPLTANKMMSNAGVSPRIPLFSLPVTTVLSFCGTSVYLCSAALYTAQTYGINMSFSEGAVLVLSCVFISVATFETPLKLTVLLFPVLERLGFPIEGIGVLTVCDLFFSIVCAAVDSWSNICANIVIAASEGDFSPPPSATR